MFIPCDRGEIEPIARQDGKARWNCELDAARKRAG
jgi:hypothetical protein